MKNINYFIEELYNKVRWGKFDYRGRISNSYYFSDETHEVCYDIKSNSIYIALLKSSGKENLLHLNSNSNTDYYDKYLVNSFIEIILEISMNDREMTRLNSDLEKYINNEEFEKASKQRDIINNIKMVLSKL